MGRLPRSAIAPTANGRAQLGQDHALCIWDAKTWQLVRIIEGTTASFDWSPDSREIVAGVGGNKIGIWAFEPGQLLRAWNIRGKNVVDTAWARKGGLIAVRVIAVNTGIEVFRADSGEALAQIDAGASSDLAWSPDGETLAFASVHDATLVRWRAKDGKVNRDIQGERAMESVSWSHDGKLIAARTYSNEPTLFVWENPTGRELHRHEKILGLSAIAFSPTMNQLAKARYLSVEIVDLGYKTCCAGTRDRAKQRGKVRSPGRRMAKRLLRDWCKEIYCLGCQDGGSVGSHPWSRCRRTACIAFA